MDMSKYLKEQGEKTDLNGYLLWGVWGDQSKIKGTFDLYKYLYFLHFEFLKWVYFLI